MIDKGADVNNLIGYGETPLITAALFTHPPEVIELLLEVPNIQVDVQNNDGYTPLHHLILNYLHKRDPVVLQNISLLIQHRARIDLKNMPWEERAKTYSSEELKKLHKDQGGKSVLR